MIVIIRRQARYRNEPVGAALRQGDEEPERGDPGDPPSEHRTDRAAEQARAIAVERGAFGRSGAPLGRRDVLGDGGQSLAAAGRWRWSGKQRAMHDEIGIAPDRRGEMGIAWQGETEMADIVRAVDG